VGTCQPIISAQSRSRRRHLPIFLDPDGYVEFSDRGNKRKAPFAFYSMPITYVIAARGRIDGYVPGADWPLAPSSNFFATHRIRAVRRTSFPIASAVFNRYCVSCVTFRGLTANYKDAPNSVPGED
jgi:hypothetical protein